MRFRSALALCLSLSLAVSACMESGGTVTMGSASADALPSLGPSLLPVTAESPLPPMRSNAEMAADFLDLEFQMESGRRLPRLTRFEGPVTIGFDAPAPDFARSDLAALVGRIRSEAGIDLVPVEPGTPAAITISFSSRAELDRIAPSAACFVVPGASSLAEYAARRGTPAADWSQMRLRRKALILLPADTSPQEIRDCLHEEVAQALGPLDDLYRLPDSVFNDDNFQSVLTGFDMLMLRVQYAPELQSGMSEAEVAARLPGIFARLNPAGAGGPAPVARSTPRAWETAVETALGPANISPQARLAAANRALQIAQGQGWQDARLGLSWFALGRAETKTDRAAALQSFGQAYAVYARLPDGGVHAAHAAMQMAALSLAQGDLAAAQAWIARARAPLPLAQNPALTATLDLIEAEILDLTGNAAGAAALRLDSAAAASYGFGASWQGARAAEIARLAVQGQGGTQG